MINQNTTRPISLTQRKLETIFKDKIVSKRPFLNGYQTTVSLGQTNLLIKNHRLTYANEGNLEITVLDRNNKPIYDSILHKKFKSDDVIQNITVRGLNKIINKYLAGDTTKM